MIFNTHYYPQGTFVLRNSDDGDKSSIWIEAPAEVIKFSNVRLTETSPIECVAECNRTSLNRSITHKTEKMHGVLRYHSLNGEFFAHLLFSTPTDVFVWDVHYKAFLIVVPKRIRDMLNAAEAHTLDKMMKGNT